MSKVVLAYDPSYKNFGVGVAIDNELKHCESHDLHKIKTKTLKRDCIRRIVTSDIALWKPSMIVVERVRMFSKGFVAMQTIMALGAMIAVIVDNAGGIPVYSVDTRSWKARVLGSAKSSKQDAVDYVESLGFGGIDHDAADAGCMALYPFVDKPKLKKEE